ncbi:MAG TPA: nucleoside recognition domain-containing protein, partial [Paludibacteraceae bacterium]|nr:nucleoside recognition domain-containing protein [Paludibacteraceae bacterium]
MVLNYIWIGFFLIAMVVAVIQFIFFNDVTVFERMVNSTFEMSEFSVMKIALPLAGVMILWLGLMNIGEKAGAVRFLSKIVGPFFGKLFPEIPKNHPVHGQLLMNFSANMLGLDNAATPLGLKAMNGLQELNKDKDTASNAQIMFLALNTSGLTLIPINIMAQRAILGAQDPTDIFIPLLMATFVSTLTAIIFVGIKQKLNLLNRVVIGWIGGIIIALSLLVYFLSQLDSETMSKTSKLIGNIILFSIIIGFIGGGLWKKINVYEAFIEGAKDGFKTSVTVMPYLVGMLVGIGVFRASGAMDLLTSGIEHLLSLISINTDFVNSLPTALMKPLSGSGAKAMMV